jgi:hypothetical protein
MADTVKPGSGHDGRKRTGGEQEQTADTRDHADRGEEPPTGGLTAVLGKLRDAAAAHDDELAEPDRLPQHG